jgi:hypothetical protein
MPHKFNAHRKAPQITPSSQQLWQLGDIRRDPARFVAGEELRGRPSPLVPS